MVTDACIIKLFMDVIIPILQYTLVLSVTFLLALTNTLAVYVTELITAVISYDADPRRRWRRLCAVFGIYRVGIILPIQNQDYLL
jgi:hypothetical protein